MAVKTAKPYKTVYTEPEKIVMNNFTKTACFELGDLQPRLMDGRLILEIPALENQGPMLTGEFVNTLQKAGLTMNEIETEMDNFHLAIEKRLFVKVLTERLVE